MPFLASHVSQTVSIPFYSPRFVPRFDILPRHGPPKPPAQVRPNASVADPLAIRSPRDGYRFCGDDSRRHRWQRRACIRRLQIAESLENLLSIYRPDSDIIRLNQAAGSHPVPLAPETFAVLDLAQRLSQMTDGAFDVTAGPLVVEVWGFTKRNGSKPTDAALQAARELVGYERLKLDHQTGTAMLDRASMSVNLGAIGKGFAIDRMAAELHRRGVNHFLIHGGNSSVMAAGDDVPGSDEGWRVAIEHPILKNTRLGGLRTTKPIARNEWIRKAVFPF